MFWLGDSIGVHTDTDARFDDECVWKGQSESNSRCADVRYSDGYIWLGTDEGNHLDADARYRDGYIWLGRHEGREVNAVARYRDGYVWLGNSEGSRNSAAARYTGSDEGAAAAAVLLLLEADSAGNDDYTMEDDPEESGEFTEESSEYEEYSRGDLGYESDDDGDSSGSTREEGYDSGGSYIPTSDSGNHIVGKFVFWYVFILMVGGALVYIAGPANEGDFGRFFEPSREVLPSQQVSQSIVRWIPEAPPPDAWENGETFEKPTDESSDLRLTPSYELLFGDKAMGKPLRYQERYEPSHVKVSEKSTTGRYQLVVVCGSQGCNDTRLIDYTDRKIVRLQSLRMSNDGAASPVESVKWSPGDHYAAIKTSVEFVSLDLHTLRRIFMPEFFRPALRGNMNETLFVPYSCVQEERVEAQFRFSSLRWTSGESLQMDALRYRSCITQSQWGERRIVSQSDVVRFNFMLPYWNSVLVKEGMGNTLPIDVENLMLLTQMEPNIFNREPEALGDDTEVSDIDGRSQPAEPPFQTMPDFPPPEPNPQEEQASTPKEGNEIPSGSTSSPDSPAPSDLPQEAVPALESAMKHMEPQHQAIFREWLQKNPGYLPAQIADCKCPNDLSELYQFFDNTHPYYVTGNLDGDGPDDFALVVKSERQKGISIVIFQKIRSTEDRRETIFDAEDDVEGYLLFFSQRYLGFFWGDRVGAMSQFIRPSTRYPWWQVGYRRVCTNETRYIAGCRAVSRYRLR